MIGRKSKIPIIHVNDGITKIKFLNKQKSENHLGDGIQKPVSNTIKVINNIYGLFCCMFGVVLTTLEPFKACGMCGGHVKIAIEGFLTYMYFISIFWFLFMFIDISIAKRSNKISIKNHNGMNRRLSVFIKSKESLFSEKLLEKNSLLENKNAVNLINNYDQQNLGVHSGASKNGFIEQIVQDDFNNESNGDVSKYFKYTYDYDNGTGELYMRVGTGLLSLCTMIDTGLNLIKLTESYRQGSKLVYSCMPAFTISVISEIGAWIFTFIQCFFIFKHANIVINKGKNIASFGLCHLVCTNFCVTLRNIVQETVHEIHTHEIYRFKHSNSTKAVSNLNLSKNFNYMITKVFPIGCNDVKKLDPYTSKGVQATYEKIAPYLFPCIIEFSLLCLTVFYIMWENLDKHEKCSTQMTVQEIGTETRKISVQSTVEKMSNLVPKSFRKQENRRMSVAERLHVNHFVVDCNKSATGLFFGLFFLLLTIISLIVYFIYKHENELLAAQISETTELILIVISMGVTIAAFLKLRNFGYLQNIEINMSYNQTLLIVALIGIYLFSIFSIIAIFAKGINTFTDTLSLIIHILSIIEGTIQCAFLLDGLRRCAVDLKTKKEKPARSLITLLLMTNLCLWLSETFSVKKYDMNTTQLDYYNVIFWSIATSIATPLAIFFRFHSSVCLSDVWKTLYQ